MGYRSYEEHERNAKIKNEIDALEREAEKLRRENETLAERIEYFASPDFQEQEAKKKLGLRRQEEAMILIREEPGTAETPDLEMTTEAKDVSPPDSLPNYKKWWSRFFASKSQY